MNSPKPHRCLSQAQVAQDQWKRCIRAVGHDLEWEPHLWMEAWTRRDSRPVVAQWTADREPAPVLAEVLVPADYLRRNP